MTKNNLITITGGSYSDIKKALKQWIALYTNDLPHDFACSLYKNGPGNHIIHADDRLDNERFYYLVNYMEYPEGIDYKVEVEGFTTGKDNNELKDQKLLIYISANDVEYDNVFAVTAQNKHYKIDFGGKIKEVKEDRQFKSPDEFNFLDPEIIKVSKTEKPKPIEGDLIDTIAKRFKIIGIIALSSFAIILFIFSETNDFDMFFRTTFILGIGIGAWFIIDADMLRSNKYYFYCFIIAILYLFFGIALTIFYKFHGVELIDLAAFSPLTILLVQWPTRKIYILLFKREPEADSRGRFADAVYLIILFMAMTFLPFWIASVIK